MNLSGLTVVLVLISMFMAGKVVGINNESPTNHNLSCPERCNMNHGFCQPNGDCSCYAGWEGEDCNQCALSPGCMHGTCDLPWQCKCKEGYGGRHCQLDLQYCERNHPCHNGGTCTNDGKGSFTCSCPQGYIGKTCGLRTTPPARTTTTSQPYCLNGGTCVFGNDFVGCERCACPKGFAGDRCKTRVMMCVTRPCANGGRCYDLINDFRCECASGFTGRHCTEDVDECSILGQGACENGGTCINKQGSYSCQCRTGFEGARCDKRTQRFVISRLPVSQHSTKPISTTTSSTSAPATTSHSSGSISSALDRLLGGKQPPMNDVIDDVAKSTLAKKQSSTKIKVTHIFKQVEVHSSDARVHDLVAAGDLVPSDEKKKEDQASVPVVQAVTFAFLGVAVALFISIGLFLWLHCKKRKRCRFCWKSRRPSDDRFIEGEEERESQSSIVRKQPPKYDQAIKKSIYQPKPGLSVRTISTPPGHLVVNPRPKVDCLYVALPHNQVTSEVCPITSIDETNSLLECSKLNRSSNFYQHR